MKRLKAERKMVFELLEACNKKIEGEPNNIEIIKLRGIIYIVAHEYDKAITDLNKIISNMPEDEIAYYLRSDCHFSKGEYDLAKQDYLRALKILFKEDKEFVKGHTEKVILEATMDNEEEKATIKKILDHEKQRVLDCIPQFNVLPND